MSPRDYQVNVMEGGRLTAIKIVDISKIEAVDKIRVQALESIKTAISEGKDLPPVIVEQYGDKYTIVDGANRLAAAEELGYTKIPVREYILPAESDYQHIDFVVDALREGKPVPPKVLADYPDLAAKYGKEAKPAEVQPRAQEAPLKAKEPWEITREEWIDSLPTEDFYQQGKFNIPSRYSAPNEPKRFNSRKEAADYIRDVAMKDPEAIQLQGGNDTHYRSVFNAINRGKPIPPEVLADYPNLAAKVKAKPAEAIDFSSEAGFALNPFYEITRITNELAEKYRTPPEIKGGVDKALDAMIEHDVTLRRSEATEILMRKTVRDNVEALYEDLPKAEAKTRVDEAYMNIQRAIENRLRGKYWDKLSVTEQNIARWLTKEKKKLTEFAVENKLMEPIKETPTHTYWPHNWINKKTGRPYEIMFGKFSRSMPQAKHRIIHDIEAGEKLGLESGIKNPGELLGKAWVSAFRNAQARRLIPILHNITAEKGVGIQLRKGGHERPVRFIERWDLLTKQGKAEGYERFDHPALDKPITFVDAKGNRVVYRGAVGVKKELYPFVDAYIRDPHYGTFSKLNFVAKSLKLGFSLFHINSLAAQEIANWRVPFVNIPRGLREIREFGPEMRLLYEQGLELRKGYEDLGYRNKFFEGEDWWSKAGNTVTKPIELMRSFIFDIVQPGMKASFAYDKFNSLLPKYLERGLTKEQCARDCVMAADGHFSGEHYKRALLESNRFMVKAYFTPEARRFWQFMLLSPTWQREHLLVAKNVAKSFMPDKLIKKLGLRELGPIKSEYRKYLLGGLCLYAANDLWNYHNTYLMDGEGKHLWENPEGKHFAARAPWNEPSYKVVDKNGRERTIPGGPAYARHMKSIIEVAETIEDPIVKIGYKLSPSLSAIIQQISPSRYRREYKGWSDMPRRLVDYLTDVGTPITWSNVLPVLKGKKELPAMIYPFLGAPVSKVKWTDLRNQKIDELSKMVKKSGNGRVDFMIADWNRRHPEYPITSFDVYKL